MKHADQTTIAAVLAWAGGAVGPDTIERFGHLADLLSTEGIAMGGLGPHETERIWKRHIADSVVYGGVAEGTDWLDVGTGIGLPAFPLAIAFPDVRISALDRARGRIDLLHRWRSILGLDNIEIIDADVTDYGVVHDSVLFRASLPYVDAMPTVTRLASRVGVFGLTHSGASDVPEPFNPLVDPVLVPSSVLDTGVTLLRIRP